jgi:sensitive to high expression protein 9
MQSMPLLLRHSIRSSLHLSRASRPIRTPLPPTGPSPFSAPRSSPRDFSVCLRCQFRSRPVWYSPNESDRGKDEHAPSERKDEVDRAAKPEVQAAEQRSPSHPEESENAQGPARVREQEEEQEQAQEHKQDIYHESKLDSTESGHGLPSSMESRRPHWSKQFSSMMDNLQSNVFVAGQRLNDLTGYSSIEALKKDIHAQGTEAVFRKLERKKH